MARTPKRSQNSRRKNPRGLRTPLPKAPGIPAIIVASLVACLLAVFFAAYSASASSGPSGSTSSTRGSKQPWCGAPGLAACPGADPNWVSLPVESPSAASAIGQTRMFHSVQSRVGHISLDAPALVHLLISRGGSDYWTNDHWVVSARNDAGKEIGVFDYVFDRAHMRIRFANYGTLLPSDPRYGHAFPYTSPSEAVQRLAVERGIGMRAGTAPELIFFPPDPAAVGVGPGTSSHPLWTAGGGFPGDPMWLIVGTDGHHYFVGNDSHVHDQSELPIVS